jgi:hypothetical protein
MNPPDKLPDAAARPLTAATADADDQWLACYCCGLSFVGSNMVAFRCHPEDRVCVGCAAWLSSRSRPIARRIYPLWRMPTYFREWLWRADRRGSNGAKPYST